MKRNMILGLLIMVTLSVLAGCASMTIVSVDSVEGPKQVAQYKDIDPKSITINATYKDGSQKRANVYQSNITFDNTKAGTQTVNVSVGFKSTSFNTEVLALQSLSGPGQSENKNVRQYLGFEKSEVKFYGTWDKIGKMEIPFAVHPVTQMAGGAPMSPDAPRYYVPGNDDITLTGIDLDKLGTQTITVEYKGFKTSCDITVVPISSVKIVKPPLLPAYKVGMELYDLFLAGMEVEGTWEGLPKMSLPNSVRYISGYNKNQEGKQTLRYTYDGKSDTFDITVK